MRKTVCCVILFLGVLFGGCVQKQQIKQNIPTLEEASGIWMGTDTTAMEPSLRNFQGQALINRDICSVSWIASAPYAGGYHTGVMKINGKVPLVNSFRWQPWQALRKSSVDSFDIFSSTRMVPEENGILWQIEITNKSRKIEDLAIELDLIGFISKYDEDCFGWVYPIPKTNGKTTERNLEVENVRKSIGKNNKFYKDIKLLSDIEILSCPKYSAKNEDGKIIISDSETEAVTAFALNDKPDSLAVFNSGGSGRWNYKIKPGEKYVFKYCMAFGDNKRIVFDKVNDFSRNFNRWFDYTEKVWNDRWYKMFTPDNTLFSGCAPILETQDKKASRVYYTSMLTMLYLLNTNLPFQERVILTGGPRGGASIAFFWDNAEWAAIQPLTDPEITRKQLFDWMNVVDPQKYFGRDYLCGEGVGNAYVANYWAIFQLIHSYITITGDYDFLNEKANGKTILESLDEYAVNWQNLSLFGQEGCENDMYKLADFGDDKNNLLECVPTYKHIVPSFNAGYIWMMREMSRIYKSRGNTQRAIELENMSDEMTARLLKLYAGNGVWNALYPNNQTVEIRHVLDFMFVGRYLGNILTDDIKSEMVDFLERELLTDTWMRAQSINDIAAEYSDRSDHGPLGAFDAWPAETMLALINMGFPEKALDFYRAIEPVTYEGTWSQSHELWGGNKRNKNARVRIADISKEGWNARDASAGIAMAQVMIKGFFGFDPDFDGNLIPKAPVAGFEGKLHHVLYKGEYYSIVLKNGISEIRKEEY